MTTDQSAGLVGTDWDVYVDLLWGVLRENTYFRPSDHKQFYKVVNLEGWLKSFDL